MEVKKCLHGVLNFCQHGGKKERKCCNLCGDSIGRTFELLRLFGGVSCAETNIGSHLERVKERGGLSDGVFDVLPLLGRDGGVGGGTFVRHQDPEQIPEYAEAAWERRGQKEKKGEGRRDEHRRKDSHVVSSCCHVRNDSKKEAATGCSIPTIDVEDGGPPGVLHQYPSQGHGHDGPRIGTFGGVGHKEEKLGRAIAQPMGHLGLRSRLFLAVKKFS